MLHVQQYLRTPGNSFATLEKERGIAVTYKDHLVKLSYTQYDSPKYDPVVMECRGLVLHRDTHAVVGGCFKRFFNYGEAPDITAGFRWDNFTAYAKEDGTWINLFYDQTAQRWVVTTRNSFADLPMYKAGPTWEKLVFGLLNGRQEQLPKDRTYIFELCSMHNKVVRQYREAKLVLLGVVTNHDFSEANDLSNDECALIHGFERPQRYSFSSAEEIQGYLAQNSAEDPTFEGIVVRDCNGLRMKLKSLSYTALHLLKGEGVNMYTPKYLLPCVISGESDELLTYFPEVQRNYDVVHKVYLDAIASTQQLWDEVKEIEDQKAFAAAVAARRHPFFNIVFNMKKKGIADAASQFREARADFGTNPEYKPNGEEIAQRNLFYKLTGMAEQAILQLDAE